MTVAGELASEPGVVRTAASKLKDFHDRYAPWIALGLGVLVRALSRQGVDLLTDRSSQLISRVSFTIGGS